MLEFFELDSCELGVSFYQIIWNFEEQSNPDVFSIPEIYIYKLYQIDEGQWLFSEPKIKPRKMM
jgi:hypothetical protein